MEKESLYHLVRDTVATYAERPIYWVKPDNQNFSAVSYFNWRADMKRFQAYLLHRLNVSQGEKLGFLCDNRYEWNLICLGLNSMGCVDVPRGCDATSGDITYILNHTRTATVICEHEKMLKHLIQLLPELPHVKNVILIDPPSKFRKLDEHKAALGNKIKLHFFIDALTIGEELLEQHGEALLKKRGEAIRPHDLATIIYTSGTTGAPKGVMLDHRALCWSVSQVQHTLPMNERDRCVVFLPPWHIAERMLEVTMMACGASMAPSGVVSLTADLTAVKPTIFVSVPRVWEGLHKRVFDTVRKQPEKRQKIFRFALNVAMTYADIMDNLLDRFAEVEEEKAVDRIARKGISLALLPIYAVLSVPASLILSKVKNVLGGQIRFAVSGTGAIPQNVATFFRALGVPILDAWGMTETTGAAVCSALPWPKRGAIGKPLPGVQIQLRDDTGKVISRHGVKGVLWMKAPSVMQGYFEAPEKTQAVLQDGWMSSGDSCMWTLDGDLKFSGRAKDTIVLASGENVEPGPVEAKLLDSEAIAQVVVCGQDERTLTAIIVPDWDAARHAMTAAGVTPPEDQAAWNGDKSVRKFYQSIIKERISNATGFKSFEKVSDFYIVPKDFEKGRELTESMKIKRNAVFEVYADEIKAMYKD
ncbi:MAG: AMP-binding protein [Leptospirales bacterium]